MYINILQQAFEDGKRIMGNIERNKLISLWMDFPSKRCGWISIVDLTALPQCKIKVLKHWKLYKDTYISYRNRLLWQIKLTHPRVAIFHCRLTYPWRVPSVIIEFSLSHPIYIVLTQTRKRWNLPSVNSRIKLDIWSQLRLLCFH